MDVSSWRCLLEFHEVEKESVARLDPLMVLLNDPRLS